MKGKAWIGFAICLPRILSAQPDVSSREPVGSLTTSCSVQMWRIEIGDHRVINQASFPVVLTTPIGPSFQLTVNHTPAVSRWYDGFKIGGISDTWVQGTYLHPNKTLLLNAGLGVPTGKTRLGNREFELGQILSQNFFRFTLPVYGQGLCARVGAAGAFPLSDKAVLGVGAQYLMRGKYNPVAFRYDFDGIVKTADEAYEPGDEVTAQVGVDVKLDDRFKMMADAEYTIYQKDRMGDRDIFKAGARTLLSVGLYREFDRQYWMALLTARFNDKVQTLQGLSLQEASGKPQGSQVELNAEYKALAFREGGFFVLGDARYYSRQTIKMLYDTRAEVDAFAAGAGVGLRFSLWENAMGDLRVKFLGGNLSGKASGRSYKDGLFGMDAGFGIKILL
jgi:hypothetical protein